jgi:histidine triad (HIT) family protein
VLVATREPFETLLDLDEATAAGLFRTVHRVAKAVQAAFEPEGLTLLQANKAAGWQTVPHVHVHVVPRYQDDGVGLIWPRKNPPLDELRRIAAKIRLS